MLKYASTVGPSLMNVICVLVPVMGIVIGLMRGFTQRCVIVVWGAILIVLSFLLKNPVSAILYKFVPFFKLEYQAANILFFEFISFFIVLVLLVIVVFLVSKFVDVVEKGLGFILSLGVPSGILSAFIRLIEFTFYLYIFIFTVFFLSTLSNSPIDVSLADKIFYNTPGFRQVFRVPFDTSIKVANRMAKSGSENSINYDSLEIMMKSKFISYNNAKYLIESKKLVIENGNELLNKYKG